MKVLNTPIEGLKVIEPDFHGDDRGFFMETWQHSRYQQAGIDARFVQSNLSRSRRGVLRGLHIQSPDPQGKLVYVLSGEVFDVAVDLRPKSETYGRWHGELLSFENRKQFYVPEGFAHGFCVTSKEATFAYMCTRIYAPESEHSLLWDDPAIGIKWPIEKPLLSARDSAAQTLAQFSAAI